MKNRKWSGVEGEEEKGVGAGVGELFHEEKRRHTNVTVVTMPPNIFQLHHFGHWPPVRILNQRDVNESSPLIHYLHFVRHPIELIMSGYSYHQMTSEAWVHSSAFELCEKKRLDKDILALVKMGVVLAATQKNFSAIRKEACKRKVLPYQESLNGSWTYQTLLRSASVHDGLWMEAYRSLDVLIQMIVTLATEPANVWRHKTVSLATQSNADFERYTESLLDFLHLRGESRVTCASEIIRLVGRPSESHVTGKGKDESSEEKREEREREKRRGAADLLWDETIGGVLREMVEYTERKIGERR